MGKCRLSYKVEWLCKATPCPVDSLKWRILGTLARKALPSMPHDARLRDAAWYLFRWARKRGRVSSVALPDLCLLNASVGLLQQGVHLSSPNRIVRSEEADKMIGSPLGENSATLTVPLWPGNL